MCALYQRHTKTIILITNGAVQAAGWDKDKDVFISVAQNTKRWKIMMHDPQVLAAIRSYSCTPVVYTRSYFCTPETVPQNKPEKITCYTFPEILSWDRAFCRPEAPSCKAADNFFFWSVTKQAYLSLTLQSSDGLEPQDTRGLDFGHDSQADYSIS